MLPKNIDLDAYCEHWYGNVTPEPRPVLYLPLAAGNLPVFETGKEKDWFVRMADALICGYVLLFAVFELLALPLIFTRQSFAVLKYSYEILACVLALAGVIFAWKNKKNEVKGVVKFL